MQDTQHKGMPLGQHDGITPLQDKAAAAKVMLPAMARLKAGKDVPARQLAIRKALSQISAEDRHWPESLASALSADGSLDGIPAHGVALAAAWALAENDVARIILSVNTQQRLADPYVQNAISGIMSAAPEFGKRMMMGHVNSDEVFMRVALAHFFQRDPASTFQMFLIDGVVRNLAKSLKEDAQSLAKSCLSRYDEIPAPTSMWGYVVILKDTTARSGYFIPEPSQAAIEEIDRTRERMESAIGALDDVTFANHAAAAFVSQYLGRHEFAQFASAIGPVLKLLGTPYVVIYVREESAKDGGGVHTQIIEIPATSVEEARQAVNKMPEVTAHDDFRRLSEFLGQMQEMQDQTTN